MRIALVSARSPLAEPGEPGWSAEVVRVRELADALAGAGHEVTVYARRDDPSRPGAARPGPGLSVHHLDAGPALPPTPERLEGCVPELARALHTSWQTDPPDVVHSHDRATGLAAGAAARELGLALVVSVHPTRDDPGGAEPDGPASAERSLLRNADRVVAGSEDELVALLRRGAPRPRLRVVPGGVDTERWRPDGPALRRTERPRLLSLAGLAAGDGVDETINALRGVPEAELFVAGGPAPGSAADGDADLARLHALAARDGVSGRVRFLGAVSRASVPRLLRSSDALVSVPRWASSGTAALEAMACGRAVVASAVGALRDTVVDEVTGVLVLPGRQAELVAAVRGALAAPGTCTAFGIAGRDRATSRFARPRLVAAVTEVYREAIAARSVPEPADDGSVTTAG